MWFLDGISKLGYHYNIQYSVLLDISKKNRVICFPNCILTLVGIKTMTSFEILHEKIYRLKGNLFNPKLMGRQQVNQLKPVLPSRSAKRNPPQKSASQPMENPKVG